MPISGGVGGGLPLDNTASFEVNVSTDEARKNLRAAASEAKKTGADIEDSLGGSATASVAWGNAIAQVVLNVIQQVWDLGKALVKNGVELAEWRNQWNRSMSGLLNSSDLREARREIEALSFGAGAQRKPLAEAYQSALFKGESPEEALATIREISNALALGPGDPAKGLAGAVEATTKAFQAQIITGADIRAVLKEIPVAASVLEREFGSVIPEEIAKSIRSGDEFRTRFLGVLATDLPRAARTGTDAINDVKESTQRLQEAWGEGFTNNDELQVALDNLSMHLLAITPQMIESGDAAAHMAAGFVNAAPGIIAAAIQIGAAILPLGPLFDMMSRAGGGGGGASFGGGSTTGGGAGRSFEEIPPVTIPVIPTAVDAEKLRREAEQSRLKALTERASDIRSRIRLAESQGRFPRADELKRELADLETVQRAAATDSSADDATAKHEREARLNELSTDTKRRAIIEERRLAREQQQLDNERLKAAQQTVALQREQVEWAKEVGFDTGEVGRYIQALRELSTVQADQGKLLEYQRTQHELLRVEREKDRGTIGEQILAAGPAGVQDFLRRLGGRNRSLGTSEFNPLGGQTNKTAQQVGNEIGVAAAPWFKEIVKEATVEVINQIGRMLHGGSG